VQTQAPEHRAEAEPPVLDPEQNAPRGCGIGFPVPDDPYLLAGSGTAPMLQLSGLEVFTGYCTCETAGTQTYSLYFKCPPTKQILCPVKA